MVYISTLQGLDEDYRSAHGTGTCWTDICSVAVTGRAGHQDINSKSPGEHHQTHDKGPQDRPVTAGHATQLVGQAPGGYITEQERTWCCFPYDPGILLILIWIFQIRASTVMLL